MLQPPGTVVQPMPILCTAVVATEITPGIMPISRAIPIVAYHAKCTREQAKVSLTADAKNLLAACIAGKNAEEAVFTRGSGNDVKDFRGTWNKITLAAGCPGLLFPDLRRSAVRNMVRAGIPETVCMKVSGHKTASVFRRYDITSEKDLADAARKIEISYRQAKIEAEQKAEQNTEAEQHATIQ